MPIPWEKVILHGPQVLEAARGLYGKWQSRSKADAIDPNAETHVQLHELARRQKAIEEGEEIQSGIIAKLAEQSQALSTGIAELKQQLQDLDAQTDDWKNVEASVAERLNAYSTRLEKLERAGEAHARKLSLALYTGFVSLAIASIALILLLSR
jgi:tetrahydromethanopterin S-methyltransferase subunit B